MPSAATAEFVRRGGAHPGPEPAQRPRATGTAATTPTSCPRPARIPFQWFWDSCFHAIALTHVNLDWAREELRRCCTARSRTASSRTRSSGRRTAIPRRPRASRRSSASAYTSSSIQPPVLAIAIERVYRATRRRGFLAALPAAAVAFYRWLARRARPGRRRADRDHPAGRVGRRRLAEVRSADGVPEEQRRPGALDRLALRAATSRCASTTAPSWRSTLPGRGGVTNTCYILGLQALSRLCSGARGGRVRRAGGARCRRALSNVLRRGGRRLLRPGRARTSGRCAR